MDVRAKKVAPNQKGPQPTAKPPADVFNFPAPIRGWILNENLAQMQPAGARILDNWYCTTTGIKVRGGREKYATLNGPVLSLIPYMAGLISKLFASTADSVFEITAPASPTVTPTAAITGRTSGYYSNCQFGTAGGNFVVIANGTDPVQNFNGTAWSSPAITGVSSSALTQVWGYANRLFFIEANTMNAWYLPVSSIAGAANPVSLAGVMTKGGYLVFGGKWSLDAGNGLDDKCVFVSSEGEVAIYQGINPTDSTNWSLVGVYLLPKPMGKNSHIAAGGDLLIATEIGLIPISASVNRDLAAMDQAAVSKPIAPYWRSQAATVTGRNWEMVKVPELGIMLISQPDVASATNLAVNLQTGAWSRFIGWDTQCLAYFKAHAFCGSADGSVYTLNSGGIDSANPYTAVYLGQADGMGAYGQQKTVMQMRVVFTGSEILDPQLTVQVDYAEKLLPAPLYAAGEFAALFDFGTWDASTWDFVGTWNVATWDVSTWDAIAAITATSQWVSIGRTGRAIAPELQMTFAATSVPNVELVGIDAQFRTGAVVA